MTPAADSSKIRAALDDHVGTVDVLRGPNNFFDATSLRALSDHAFELQDEGARVVVIRSEGKHFCAGANFHEGELQTDRAHAAREVYRQGVRLFDLDIPIVAAVQGGAIGGGLGLACAADFRVASPGSRFHANFSSLGFHQGFGLSATLPRIVGRQTATRMLVTSGRVTGEDALAMGLVDRLAADGAVHEAAHELAVEIATMAPLAVRAIRRTMRGGLLAEVQQALERELAEQIELWDTEDSVIGIQAARDRRTPQFVGR